MGLHYCKMWRAFFNILYIIMHFFFYQIRHVLFEEKNLKNYIYCSSPQSHGPYQALSLQGSNSNVVKDCGTFPMI